MARAKILLPEISLEDVDNLLQACVRPDPNDPSLLEVRREMVPPLLLPPLLRIVKVTGKGTSAERLQVRQARWGEVTNYLWQLAGEFVWQAESLAQADRGPSASDLEQAPWADPYVLGQSSSGDYCLYGLRSSLRDRKRKKPFRTKLTAIAVHQGWALSPEGWFRLGRRIHGREFQELAPRFTNFLESGDEETEYKLLAVRARVAWKLSQLKLPSGEPPSQTI